MLILWLYLSCFQFEPLWPFLTRKKGVSAHSLNIPTRNRTKYFLWHHLVNLCALPVIIPSLFLHNKGLCVEFFTVTNEKATQSCVSYNLCHIILIDKSPPFSGYEMINCISVSVYTSSYLPWPFWPKGCALEASVITSVISLMTIASSTKIIRWLHSFIPHQSWLNTEYDIGFKL